MLLRIGISLVLVAGALGASVGGFRALAAKRKAPERSVAGAPLPVVRVEPVRRRDYQDVVRGYGVARPLREARVTAEVPGVVRYVAPTLRAGAEVAPPGRGENGSAVVDPDARPLIELDRRDLEDALARLAAERAQSVSDQGRNRAEVANLEAQLQLADRRLDTARAELTRIEKLVPDTLPESEADRQRLAAFALEQLRAEVVSRRDQAVATAQGIDARLDALDVQERQAKRDLERTRVFAPFPGRVVSRHVEVGTRVAPGAPLFDLVDLRHVEVAVSFPAGRYDEVRATSPEGPGSRVVLRRRAEEDAIAEARIERIDPRIDPRSRTFLVYVELDGGASDAPVAAGEHLLADVEAASFEDVIPVPREAFLGEHVYVVSGTAPDGSASARRIRPHVVKMLAEIALVRPEAGVLEDGDRVVVSNLEDIADGSRLRPVDAEPEPVAEAEADGA